MRDHQQLVGLKHRDMEHKMDGTEGFGESDGKPTRANLGQDLEGTKEFIGEFFGKMGGMEKTGFDQDVIANLEVQGW